MKTKRTSKTKQKTIIPIRFGLGYDVHQLVKGRKLILGGVRIRSKLGLLGHSDADVLIHAICDALLGAAALGDIGKHFPNTDKSYRDISSLILLRHVGALLNDHGFKIGNIDTTVVLEQPKIGKYTGEMSRRIGKTLRISPEQISVKATTHEGLGTLGRSEGCAAFAIASLVAIPGI